MYIQCGDKVLPWCSNKLLYSAMKGVISSGQLWVELDQVNLALAESESLWPSNYVFFEFVDITLTY